MMEPKRADELADRAERLISECQDVLEDEDLAMQGSVLAYLVAEWLSAHIVEEDVGRADQTASITFRNARFEDWLSAVSKARQAWDESGD